MAVSKTASQFQSRMKMRGQEVITGVERKVIAAALAANDVLATITPVDTGKARANWLGSIGTPTYSNDLPPVYGSGEASTALVQSRNKAIFYSWRVGMGSLYLSNGVPYIVQLEKGSSKQAPLGMTRQAINAAKLVSTRIQVITR